MIDPQNITIPIAVLAGLLSFASPCVLPLVPAYIGYLTGQATAAVQNNLAAINISAGGEAAAQARPARWLIALHGVFFVLGFSFVFVSLGVTVGLIGGIGQLILDARALTLGTWCYNLGGVQCIRFGLLPAIGGALIILLGLHVMGVVRIPFLYYDTRSQKAPRPELGFLGSLLMGITFSAGWTPCIGPILGTLLGLGFAVGSAGQAAVMLTAYSLGLGIPFLLTALLLDRATLQFRKLQKHMRTIEIVSGVLLMAVGLLVLTGKLGEISSSLRNLTQLTCGIDQWLVSLTGGQSISC